MHNHDKNGDGMKSMMWMMIICCAVPLLLILVLGTGGSTLGAPTWIILGAVAAMAIAHFWMMFKKQKDHGEAGKSKDEHQHGCH